MKKWIFIILSVALLPGVFASSTLWEAETSDEPMPKIYTVLEGGSLSENRVNETFSKYTFTVQEDVDLLTWKIPLDGYRVVHQGNYSAIYLSPGGRWMVTVDWSDIKSLDITTKKSDKEFQLSTDLSQHERTQAVELDPSIEIDGPLGIPFRGLSTGKNGYEDSNGYFHTVIIPSGLNRDIYHVWENSSGWNQEHVWVTDYDAQGLSSACAGFQNASGEYMMFAWWDGDDPDETFVTGTLSGSGNLTSLVDHSIAKADQPHGSLRCIYDYGYGEYRFFGTLYKDISLYNGTLEDPQLYFWEEPDHSVGVSYFGASSLAIKDYENAMAIWGYWNGTVIAAEWDGVSWAAKGHVTDNGETTDYYYRGYADVTWFDHDGSTHYIVVYANNSMHLRYRIFNTTSDSWEDSQLVDWGSGPLDGSYSPKVETWNGTPQIVCAEESDNHLYFWNVSDSSDLGDTPIPWNRYLMCGDDTEDGGGIDESPKVAFHIANGSNVGHVTWTNSSGVYYLDYHVGSDAPDPANVSINRVCGSGDIYIGDIYVVDWNDPAGDAERIDIWYNGSILHSTNITGVSGMEYFANLPPPSNHPSGSHTSCLANSTANITCGDFEVYPYSRLWVAWTKPRYSYESISTREDSDIRGHEYHKLMNWSCGDYYMEMLNSSSDMWSTDTRLVDGSMDHLWWSWVLPFWGEGVPENYNYTAGEQFSLRLIQYYPNRTSPECNFTWDISTFQVMRPEFQVQKTWLNDVIQRDRTNAFQVKVSGYNYWYSEKYGSDPYLKVNITNLRTGEVWRTWTGGLPSLYSYPGSGTVDWENLRIPPKASGSGSRSYLRSFMLSDHIYLSFPSIDTYRISIYLGNKSTVSSWELIDSETVEPSGRWTIDTLAKSFQFLWGKSPDSLESLIVLGALAVSLGIVASFTGDMGMVVLVGGWAVLFGFFIIGWVGFGVLIMGTLGSVVYLLMNGVDTGGPGV